MLQVFFLLILTGTALLIWAYAYERRAFQINTSHIKLKKPVPQPFRILHLSDIHFASRQTPYDRFFDRLAKDEYDLIIITGDIIDCMEGLHGMTENIGKLRSRYGIYAVYGNHDYYDYRWRDVFFHNLSIHGHPKTLQRTDLIDEALAKLGVRVLKNQSVSVSVGYETLWIHGVDDPTTGRAQIEKITPHFKPHKINILLTHSIDLFFDIGEDQIDLACSGHSHGGQICLPGFGPLITHTTMGRDYISGVKRLKGTLCSISRGIGTSRCFPFRFLARPEAIVLNVTGK